MVAYSFKGIFTQQVTDLTKRQTVRANRMRHARPGEPVQLYFGMRTRHCRKLVEPDPICVSVTPIRIGLSDLIDDRLASIMLDSQPLGRAEIEAFAIADGFSVSAVGDWKKAELGIAGSARFNMGRFWAQTHGPSGVFDGVVIRWEAI